MGIFGFLCVNDQRAGRRVGGNFKRAYLANLDQPIPALTKPRQCKAEDAGTARNVSVLLGLHGQRGRWARWGRNWGCPILEAEIESNLAPPEGGSRLYSHRGFRTKSVQSERRRGLEIVDCLDPWKSCSDRKGRAECGRKLGSIENFFFRLLSNPEHTSQPEFDGERLHVTAMDTWKPDVVVAVDFGMTGMLSHQASPTLC